MSEYGNLNTKKDLIFSGYKMALYAFWTNRTTTSVEHLSKIIADNTDEDISSLYRLWIEILSSQSDREALSSLNRHLLYRLSTEETSSHNMYTSISALRGLIHYELDELQAAKLIHTSIAEETKNQYVQELDFLIDNRLNLHPSTDGLWSIRDSLDDYYVMSTLVKGLIVNKETTKLNQLLTKMDTMFGQSPAYRQYRLHSYFDCNDYNTMYKLSTELMEMYPTNTDYSVFAAYAACKLEDYEEARSILKHSYQTTREDDLDVLYLLLVSEVELLKQAYDSSDISYINQMFNTESDYNILVLLSKVETLLESNGFLSIDIDSIKNDVNTLYWKLNINDKDSESEVQDGSSQQEEKLSAPSCWLYILSDSEYHKLRNQPTEKITTLKKELKDGVKPSDICFMVYTDYRNQSSRGSGAYLRIGAIYEVKSYPDSIHDNACELTLITRPEYAIPIDYEFKDKLNQGESFELDISALDIIIDSISSYNEDRVFASSIENIMDSMLTKKIS